MSTEILILKTGALGDVLRTTSILEGLHARYPEARVTWVTAPGALDLVQYHPRVERVVTVSPKDADAVAAVARDLADVEWDRILSLDDEEPLCGAAAELAGDGDGVLSGAYLDEAGERRYTPDVAEWFDMGLLSVYGKEEADRRKVANERSHARIYADMFGVEMGRPELPLPDAAVGFAEGFALRTSMHVHGPAIGLNTGSGGRWESKKLSVERVVELVGLLNEGLAGKVSFVVLGGPDEEERNAEIVAALKKKRWGPRIVDGGCKNSMLNFAAIVDRLDLLVTSDSLALHLAVARRVPVVAFFAPTSAAEIELYGKGEKVVSTAPDYCSYRRDADTSTLTAERIAEAVLRRLG